MRSVARPPCDPSSHIESGATPLVDGGDAIVRVRAPVHDGVRPRDAWSADRAAVAERAAGHLLVVRIARAAEAIQRNRTWGVLGFLHANDYCRERLDRSSRWLQDHAALGAGLSALPGLEAAVLGVDGPPIGGVVATAISRIASADTVSDWIERARRSTVREILEEIRACRAMGDSRSAGVANDVDRGGGAPVGDAMRRTLEEPEPELEECVEVRFAAPRAVVAAVEEVLDLHRAVSGYDATLVSLAEALVAEAAAGPAPADAHIQPLAVGERTSRIEHALARVTQRWAALAASDERAVSPHTMATEGVVQDPDGDAVKCAGGGEPVDAKALHAHTCTLLQLECVRERRIGRLLYEMSRRNDWATLGFASAGHYAVERLGMGRRTAESRAGIVRALRALPVVGHAYESGRIGLASAWILARVLGSCGPDTVTQTLWVQHARTVTVKRLRDEWRAMRLRDLDPAVAAQWEAAAVRRDATKEGRPAACEAPERPRPVTDAEWIAGLSRPPGRTRERLRALRVPGLDDPHAPTSWLTSADVCARFRLPVGIAPAFVAVIESARRLAERTAAAIPWDQPWATEVPVSLRAARMFADRQRRVPAWVGLLALLEDYAATWDDPAVFPKRRWNRCYAAGGWRCQAPGCTARMRIEDHHIVYRSHQGSNDLWNQLCLCRAHHQQGEHGELARCRGQAPLDVTWRLGRKESASWYRNERRLDKGDDGDVAYCSPER